MSGKRGHFHSSHDLNCGPIKSCLWVSDLILLKGCVTLALTHLWTRTAHLRSGPPSAFGAHSPSNNTASRPEPAPRVSERVEIIRALVSKLQCFILRNYQLARSPGLDDSTVISRTERIDLITIWATLMVCESRWNKDSVHIKASVPTPWATTGIVVNYWP